jgi:putative FmdB family regulatory protein
MPIYEYQCIDCGCVFDAIRPIDEADDAIACDECGSEKTKRMLSKCYARNQDGSISGQSGSCSGCQGGSCASCGH